jgi:carbon starvation protein
MIQDAWLKNGELTITANPVPWVCLVLIVLSMMLVIETIYALMKHQHVA